MKKSLKIAALALAGLALAIGLSVHRQADARITGSGTDVWCSGVGSYEICIDSTGNIIPTTTNTGAVGASSYRFANIYSVLGNFSSTLTAAALSVTTTLSLPAGSITTAMLATSGVTSAKMSMGSTSVNAALCVKTAGAIGICGSAVGSNGGCTCQ